MNLRQLKYFLATAELGQVSRAASELSISQSSVTSAIRELEQSMGTTLFNRTAHGMDLTPTGRDLLSAARDVMEKVQIAQDIGQNHSDVTGTINIAATYTVCGYFLPYHLDRLSHRFPNLTINISELNRESIEEGLISNRFDVAVILTSNTSNPELATQTLMRSHRRHADSGRSRQYFDEILGADWTGAACTHAYVLDRGCAVHGRQRAWGYDPVRYGLPTVVSGRAPYLDAGDGP